MYTILYAKGKIGDNDYQTSMFTTLWKEIDWIKPDVCVSYKKVDGKWVIQD